ncbi:unnamed protein product, partial [Cuscuta epithymum]
MGMWHMMLIIKREREEVEVLIGKWMIFPQRKSWPGRRFNTPYFMEMCVRMPQHKLKIDRLAEMLKMLNVPSIFPFLLFNSTVYDVYLSTLYCRSCITFYFLAMANCE